MSPTVDTQSLDALLGDLLRVTQKIGSVFAEDEDFGASLTAYTEREALLAKVEERTAQGEVLTSVGRVYLDQLRALDAQILSAGTALVERVRAERRDLQRRRTVIEAHASREREEPRLITLKA